MSTNDLTETEVFGPVGYIAACLAHIRAGHPIEELDTGLVVYLAPTQAEVDQARHMVEVLNILHRRPDEDPDHFDPREAAWRADEAHSRQRTEAARRRQP
jgi:hypothetical protein